MVFTFCTSKADKFAAELYVQSKQVYTGEHTELSVGVKNPTQGLRYRWRADRGSCNPKDSEKLSTIYTAPSSAGDDRVSLEVVQGNKIIYATEATIKVIENTPRAGMSVSPVLSPSLSPTPSISGGTNLAGRTGKPVIRITQIPPYDPAGGPDSSADIAGEVSGLSREELKNYRVVIYARTDKFYVQPLAASPFTSLEEDGRFTTWTHGGSLYAALLVKEGFKPPNTADNLPSGNLVVAVTTVKGVR